MTQFLPHVTEHGILVSGAVFMAVSVLLSTYLISRHMAHFNLPHIQSKICGIAYMVPIYAVDSFLGLLWPSKAVYINMLRDCYEAYVLYLFLSLMLSYLNCDEDDSEVAMYIEKKLPRAAPWRCCAGPLHVTRNRGRAFLKYYKFGTLQYCVIRPLTALLAIILTACGVYDENNYSILSPNLYVQIAINISVCYAFIVLGNFYYTLKEKLMPFEPVGKFLCIKFVIFFAFWQSVFVSALVHFGVIREIGDYGPETLATGLQDYLICFEMMFVSVAMLYTFPWSPFTKENLLQDAFSLLGDTETDLEQDQEREGEGEEDQEEISLYPHTHTNSTERERQQALNDTQQAKEKRAKTRWGRHADGRGYTPPALTGFAAALQRAATRNHKNAFSFNNNNTRRSSASSSLVSSSVSHTPLRDKRAVEMTRGGVNTNTNNNNSDSENENESNGRSRERERAALLTPSKAFRTFSLDEEMRRATATQDTTTHTPPTHTHAPHTPQQHSHTQGSNKQQGESAEERALSQQQQKSRRPQGRLPFSLLPSSSSSSFSAERQSEKKQNVLLAHQQIMRARQSRLQQQQLLTPSRNALSSSDALAASGDVSVSVSVSEQQSSNKAGSSKRLHALFDKHFATGSALRDFNESMPVVLPSPFEAQRGTVIASDPEERLRQAQREQELRRKNSQQGTQGTAV